MPRFSKRSKKELDTCHQDIQDIVNEVIKHYDCTVLQGHRNEAEQTEYFRTGKSKVEWPNSKHNSLPSNGIDLIRCPIDWADTKGHYHFAGFVQGIAAIKGIKIRWGGDWSMDNNLDDQTFNDLVHFERVED